MFAFFRNLRKIGTHEGTVFWINLEPCGLVCGLLTYFFLGYAMFSTTRYVIFPWLGLWSFGGLLNTILFNALCALAAIAHFQAMVTDPGSVPRSALPLTPEHLSTNTTLASNSMIAVSTGSAGTGSPSDKNDEDAMAKAEENGDKADVESVVPPTMPAPHPAGRRKEIQRCKKCRVYKPPRAHHCSQCRRCITKMDHHCPWVNNCVGVGNQKLFLLFLLYTFCSCLYAMTLIGLRYSACYHDPHSCATHGTSSDGGGAANGHICVLFLVIESLLFGLFTCCMLSEQYESIDTEETTVERIIRIKYSGGGTGKGDSAASVAPILPEKGKISEFVEIFGARSSDNSSIWAWRNILGYLLPVPVQYCSNEMRDRIYGYTTNKSPKTLSNLGKLNSLCKRKENGGCPPCDASLSSCSSRDDSTIVPKAGDMDDANDAAQEDAPLLVQPGAGSQHTHSPSYTLPGSGGRGGGVEMDMGMDLEIGGAIAASSDVVITKKVS